MSGPGQFAGISLIPAARGGPHVAAVTRRGPVAALLVYGATALSCRNNHQTGPPAAPGPPEVLVVPAAKRDVPIYREAIGTLSGMVDVEIRARVPGFLRTQHYREGALVKQGQLLFTIDPSTTLAAVAQAEGERENARASLARADSDVRRLKPLLDRKAVSQEEYDHALADRQAGLGQVSSAEAKLREQRIDLGYTQMTSPVDGVAGLALVRSGNLVGQSEPTLLTTVSSLDPIRVTFTIPEQVYLRLAERLRALELPISEREQAGITPVPLELILADDSRYPYTGRLALADRQVDPATGSVKLQALFPNPDYLLLPGQYGRIRAVAETVRGAVVVPQRALQELQGIYQVMVVGRDNKIQLRRVKRGEQVGRVSIIDSGLQPGERVVVEGFQRVQPGALVNPRPAPAALNVDALLAPGDGGPPPDSSAGDAGANQGPRD
jgi:membrane fusion protein (multidrug efflux system)